MRKKRRDDCHLSELSLSRADTNFSEDLRCSDIWMRDYSSLLRFVKKVEDLIETFIFKLIRTCEWDEKLSRSIDSNQMTVKFSITTTTKYWWIDDFEYKNYSRNWYVKSIVWCRLDIRTDHQVMMLSFVVLEMKIELFRSYEAKTVD